MSSYTNKTYIVFFDLPKDIASKLDKIKSNYSSSRKKYPAHITLKQDEDYIINADEICKIVYNQINNQTFLNVKLKRPEIARNKEGWNIHIPVESTELNQLVKKMSKALEDYIDPNSPRAGLSTKWEQSNKYYSHISIKGGGAKTDPKLIFKKIKNEEFGFSFPEVIDCNTITVANWQNHKWHKIKSYTLNNAK